MGQDTGKKSLRTDFVMLLHLCIIGLIYAGWLIYAFAMIIEYGGGLYSYEYLIAFGIPLALATFLSVMAVALSNVLRQKWWVAIIGTILLLGTPLVALVITWIGKQIARFFYLATPEDLARTKLVLNMKVKPRKGKMIFTQEAESDANLTQSMQEIQDETDPMTALKEEIEASADEPHVAGPSYFGLWQTTIAALFGGILAGGVMISINYLKLKEKTNFFIGLAVSMLAQFVLIVVNAGLWYADSYLLIMIPIIIAIPVCVYIWHSELQNEEIGKAISSALGKNSSWWSVIAFVALAWIFNWIFHFAAEEIIWSLGIPFF